MIQEIDTTELDQNSVSEKVTTTILNKLEELIMEKIGYIQKDILRKYDLFRKDESGVSSKWLQNINIPLEDVEFSVRDKVEEDNSLLQFIPIGVLTDPEHSRVLILKKQSAASKNSPEKNAYLIWFGGHMREEDKIKGLDNFEDLAKITLKRETEEELGISISLDDIKPFYIYSISHVKSENHLAICFIIERDLDGLKLAINTDELMQNKGNSISGTYVNIDEFRKGNILVEDWSRNILLNVFDVSVERQNEQIAFHYSFSDKLI